MSEGAAAAVDVAGCDGTAERWQAGVESAVCFIAACDYTDIDPRGPVWVRNDPMPHYACTEHWEAIIGILGRQVGSDDEMRIPGD